MEDLPAPGISTVALTVTPAAQADLAQVVTVLDEAAQFVVDRGAEGWRPGQWRAHRILEAIERGETFLARRDGVVVGTCSLQWTDETVWSEWPEDAGYASEWLGFARARKITREGAGRCFSVQAAEPGALVAQGIIVAVSAISEH